MLWPTWKLCVSSALQTFANCGAGGKQLDIYLDHLGRSLLSETAATNVKVVKPCQNISEHHSMQPALMTAWMAVHTI